MKSYAGIGTRNINNEECKKIKIIAKIMNKQDYILYSGNANGSDIAFQEGSNGKCVIMLPWNNYNLDEYDYNFSRDHFVVGKTNEGLRSVDKFHPSSNKLSDGVKLLMARNYHQILGYKNYPRVNVVICCADRKYGKIIGGTGQAIRIAEHFKIPIINIRDKNWNSQFETLIKGS